MGANSIGGASAQETLLAAGAKTASGTTAINPSFAGVHDLLVQVAVTAAAGTGSPTLDVIIQQSVDDGTNWHDVAGLTFTQVASAAAPIAELKVPTGKIAGALRVKYTIAGTNPSFTFSVKAFARG